MIEVLQRLVGPEVSISSTQVSRVTERLDVGLAAWRERPLGATPYVLLDARYERVREAGQIVDCAVLVAVGITADGKRRVLGVSVALSEAEVHWRTFLDSLIRRGLSGGKLIVSDDHAGLKAARRATLPSVPWQRCQFHLQQNAQSYIARVDQRESVGRRIRAIFNAPDRAEAERLLKHAIGAWRTEAPKLAEWTEENLAEGFAVFNFPQGHRVRLRTTDEIGDDRDSISHARVSAGRSAAHRLQALPRSQLPEFASDNGLRHVQRKTIGLAFLSYLWAHIPL